MALEEDSARDAFRPAIQPIIAVLGSTLTRGDEQDATSIMEYLVAIANSQPIFFKGNVDAVVEAMLTVARSKDLEFPTRSIALELMVTLTETAPALARDAVGLCKVWCPWHSASCKTLKRKTLSGQRVNMLKNRRMRVFSWERRLWSELLPVWEAACLLPLC